LLLFALASVSDDDISAAIWAYTTSAALATTIFATKLWRIEQPQDPPRLQHLKEIGLYGMRYYFARIGNLVDLGIGTALLSAVAESSSVGIFAATSALALKTLLITESAESTILPRIAQDPEKSIDLTLRT